MTVLLLLFTCKMLIYGKTLHAIVTRVHVTSRDPLSFTVNGCSGLQAYREQLFDQQFAALEYCAYLVQDREVHAGEIRILLAMLRGIRNTILLDKEQRPRRPRLYVGEGREKNVRMPGRTAPPCFGGLHSGAAGVVGFGFRRAFAGGGGI